MPVVRPQELGPIFKLIKCFLMTLKNFNHNLVTYFCNKSFAARFKFL